ncbi:ATP-dependent DNA ligase [Tuwongella immobilis]|uniref:DNA ligase (ATP) n=1 Tax=Tuwongella immobilis TaxID=692036 RepID=A0A6C2YTG0_9BACT|nr:ATP-dependent DNA ligase [Tuwongella immobilis]VIP05000.1 atp-dependent dna ligase : ATP dependent DNA ligase OS=Roseiflexus sp. (strain RS-1) GN=RoseRS_1583 PE=4 SV=1: DNA_ligase_A_N: DNA_ligase_A_M: DNA_ligase_A_C [Tuwongella immobilis]VTS07358.1 atp-dependent dna ligase : ATP dependent DNA ligase OS=Roseiflexus sp. (strain RS-1) GN=RoseRS_1583 PE=4 SV=1: DNA_ligase_A_N: DNA_ligase_A_M: DNA_ligase_A_C [Tuwongella immobilis]
MRAFAELYANLDATTKTNVKVAAMVEYFSQTPPAEAAWAIYVLTGRKLRQLVPNRKLREWAMARAGISEWLFEECYSAVGDSAETIALILPQTGRSVTGTLDEWIEQRLLPLRTMSESAQQTAILSAWDEMSPAQAFIYNKLITGALRVGVSQLLVVRALAQVAGIPANVMSHRLMGDWSPTPRFYEQLRDATTTDADASRPYPFCLAHPLEAEPETLGDVHEWIAEWKWDGIRSQLIRRQGAVYLWSRGEELVTDRYPELRELAEQLPDGTVIDGEILPWRGEQMLPFGELQRRIGRKSVSKSLLAEVPVVLMAYDLLEFAGRDLRESPLIDRRQALQQLHAQLQAGSALANGPHPAAARLRLSPTVAAESWAELHHIRGESRSRQVEGLMLKRRDSAYRVGRVRGDWWKWKIQPFSVDAVLMYAQRGSGKRASLYTDYTFGVWDGGMLVPFAKAYSGLTDAEIAQVDAFIRANTVEKFGPVRTVKPELVFELGFEGIQRSTRHKSGVAVRFPRMLRQRFDKPAAEADSLDAVKALIALSPEATDADFDTDSAADSQADAAPSTALTPDAPKRRSTADRKRATKPTTQRSGSDASLDRPMTTGDLFGSVDSE